jgi:hypothetical protein
MAERTVGAQCGRLLIAGILTAIVIVTTLWQLASSSTEAVQIGVVTTFSAR